MSKIGFYFQFGSNPLVFSKFTSSIKCNGVNVLLVWLEHIMIASPTVVAFLSGTSAIRLCLDLRSARVTSAPVPLLPITVSASQSPNRSFVSTSFGRSSMDTAFLIVSRLPLLPRRYFLWPWRKCSDSLPP